MVIENRAENEGGMRSMIPFIRRRPMGRAIYGQLYTGGGVTLVFTDPGVINPVHAPLHAHPSPSRAEFESRIPKIVSDRNVELPFVKRYPILHQIARCPIIPPNSTCPSFPHPSPPEFGQGLTLDGGGGEWMSLQRARSSSSVLWAAKCIRDVSPCSSSS